MRYEVEPLIAVRNLSKTYEVYRTPVDRLRQILFGRSGKNYFSPFIALQDISFDVDRGKSLGVIGRNGAGKSTLLQIITGTLVPTSGEVKTKGTIAAILELGAGFNPEFSGRDNILLYCNLLKMDSNLIKARFSEIVEFSELAAFIDQPVKNYSSGMVARLAFSVIAHLDADVLIIDEALSVGDAAFSQKCMRFFREFKKQGSIFFVSHDIAAVRSLCDEVIWIDGGKIVSRGDPASVCDAYLASIYASPDSADLDSSEADFEVGLTDLQDIMLDELVDHTSTFSGAPAARFDGFIIERFSFQSDASSFGEGGAKIVSAFLMLGKRKLRYANGGDIVSLMIEVCAERTLHSPIVGFFVKDRLGQPLFGANTYSTYKDRRIKILNGEKFWTRFVFRMPTLLVGDYSITIAVAEGTLESHVQLQWVHDAVLFEVIESSLDGVLVGIPMEQVAFLTEGIK
jgi:lipopolysaccharide transport system ATP-binding protein